MRTAKYHDYTLLRIVTFIILVILGILAYKHFVKPPCEHTAAGNSWVTVDATCTEDGYRYKVCTECGEQFGNQTLAALGHKLDNNVITIEKATCTKTGTGYKACSVCSEQLEFVEIPVVEHTYGETVVENEKEHTLTQGASFEKVVYCTVCDGELSREKVDVEHTVTTTINNIANPTCTESGEEQTIVYCNDCEKVISTTPNEIEPLGHQFVWELTYEDGEFILNGECTATECGHEYDPAVDTGYTYDVQKDKIASVAPTCVSGYDIYVATVSLNGKEVAKASTNVELDPVDDHKLYVTIKDTNGNYVVNNPENYLTNEDGYIVDEDGNLIDFLQYALSDEYGVYYNISTPGISLVFDRDDGQSITEAMATAWDENGFALGVFKCSSVNGEREHWVTVRVYNDLA